MKKLILFTFLTISLNGYCDKFVWNQKANYPSFPRHRCTAISIGNKGYMGLGHINSGTISQAYQDWWEYDPATNSWTQKADYPLERFAVAAFTIGNKGYAGSGNEQNFGGRDEFFEFDPIANTWIAKANFPEAVGGNIAFEINGLGYMGMAGSSLYAYNPITNSWTMANGSSSLPNGAYSSCFVLNNKAYIIPSGTTNLIEYNPATGSVVYKAPFISDSRYAATGFAVRGKGYLGLGWSWTNSIVLKDFYEYDPVLDKWDTIPKAFPGVRRNYTPSFVIGDNAYLGTGSNGTNLGDVWGYEWKIAAGVEEGVAENSKVSLYPNPCADILTIRFLEDNLEADKIIITNMLGKIVFESNIIHKENKLDIAHFARGAYNISVLKNGTSLYTKKLIFN